MARLPFVLGLALTASFKVFAASDSTLLSLLPAESQMVTSMDVDSSRNSTFGQFMLQQITLDGNMQDFVNQTGFDPRRDLQNFLFAALPSTDNQHGRFVLLARGLFDQSRISALAKSKGVRSEQIQGVDVLIPQNSASSVAFGFPETGIAVFGDRASVEQVLRNRANPTVLNTSLQDQISKASGSNDAWFASILPGSNFANQVSRETGSTPAQGARALQGVVQSSGGVRFGNTVQLSFNAVTRSEKDALSLTDVIRFVSSAMQMQRDKDPRAAVLAPAFDSMSLKADGREVHSTLSFPEADLERLVKLQGKSGSQSPL